MSIASVSRPGYLHANRGFRGKGEASPDGQRALVRPHPTPPHRPLCTAALRRLTR